MAVATRQQLGAAMIGLTPTSRGALSALALHELFFELAPRAAWVVVVHFDGRQRSG